MIKEMMEKVLLSAKIAFLHNCSPCHQEDGRGKGSYPNLMHDKKMWGNSPEDIYYTVKYGIRSLHDEARDSYMPPFEDKLSDE